MSDDSGEKQWTSVFPFFMVLSAFFGTGLVFMAVNAPLLIRLTDNAQADTVHNVMDGVFSFWAGYVNKDTAAIAVVVYALSAVAAGFVVQPLALVLTTASGAILTALAQAVGARRPLLFYAPPAVFGDGYPSFMDWLHRNRIAKSLWEWELFNHYIYSGIAMNISVASLTLCFLWSPGWPQRIFLLAISALSISYSLMRSAVLRSIHDYYASQARAEIAAQATAQSSLTPHAAVGAP